MADENWQLVEEATGRVVVSKLEVARSFWQRSVGLLGRTGLDAGTALWLEPCSGIHTFAMRFSMDALFLDSGGKAVKCLSNVPPWRMVGPVRGARVVVELPAGELVKQNIQVGTRYSKRPI